MQALAKAVALLAWADEKLEIEEIKAIQEIFKKYGVNWKDARPLVEAEMEAIIEGDGGEDEKDDVLNIGVLDFGEVDSKDMLDDLASIAVADKEIDYREVEMIHKIASAANMDPVIASAALLAAAKNSNSKLCFS